MVKIYPINNIPFNTAKTTAKETAKRIVTNPVTVASTAALGSFGVILSTFLQNFNRTSDELNYFQFKTDPKTGKHYEPDVFQKAAGMHLALGNDVLVTAPTGTGKTAIAEYIITKNLNEGGKTFYTTPLKALSNEKFLDFQKIYGEENVGLLTGDTKINTNAPIVVMTTEVYRNMVASGTFNIDGDSSKGTPKNLKTVIFDELQYLGDIDRGGIWEQSIMFTPQNVQMLSLSATIGNNEEINNWLASVKRQNSVSVSPKEQYIPHVVKNKETVLINVPSENRHVPLSFSIEHVVSDIKLPRGGSKKEKIKAKQHGAKIASSIYATPREDSYKRLTHKLNEEGKLPAIYFVFSKKESRHLLKYLSTESELLTTKEERNEIENTIKRYKDEGIYLGESLNIEALLKGYAVHNAGLLPSQKRLVEELFQKKLVKVVIATETLSAGINMPAKTTVISSPRKPSSTSDGGDDHKRTLTPNEFHQMAGRAGRRGIDTQGYCIPLSCNKAQTELYEELIDSPSNPLESNLELDYSFITNYMANFNNEEELKHILSKSFYVTDNSGEIDDKKLKEILGKYNVRRDILLKENYVKDGKLTVKARLLGNLNGYEQIPIINILSDKSLEKLNPIQIAAVIGGLANIEYDTIGEFPQKPFILRNTNDTNFVSAAQDAFFVVKDYERKSVKLHPDKEMRVSTKAMEHIYNWAELNCKSDKSKRNWRNLYSGDLRASIRDEGTLFKEINMTIDLLKQLIEACSDGEKYSETDTDIKYYQKMAEKFRQAIYLIQQEPVTENSIG